MSKCNPEEEIVADKGRSPCIRRLLPIRHTLSPGDDVDSENNILQPIHEMMTPNWGRQASKRKESFRIEMEMGKCSVWYMWMPYCLGGSEEVVEQVN